MISVRNLVVQIGDRTILDGVHFELPAQGFLAVLGPNGGGKSTLVRCLLQLQPYDGRIDFDADAADQI